MTVNAYDASSGRVNEYPEYEAQFGEDPARFLESNELMATARIAGIRDPDLLAAYEDVAEDITAGSYRTTILEAIAERKADLGLETCELPDGPTPEATTDPVPATDGGQDLEHDEGDVDAADDSDPEPADSAPIHPDTNGLEAGQVLVLEFANATEYAWPQTAAADDPFVLRTADGERTLTQPELFDHIQSAETERRDAAAIDELAPSTAATGGDA